MARSLTIAHIFTGNDFNPAFSKKGKKRPFAILKKNNSFQDAFIELLRTSPNTFTTTDNTFKVIEEFVCRMYSLKTKNDVNKGRFEIFEKKYKHRDEHDAVFKKNITGFDASSLPPSKEELLQQIKRTIYISSIWCNAHMRLPTNLHPEDCGWTEIDNAYEYYWYDGAQCPTFKEISASDAGKV